MRVLDLDLDFFVHGAAHWRSSTDDRLDDAASPPWSLDATMAFLRDQCGLHGPVPGFVVEHHGQLFELWRDSISMGQLPTPMSVTHVDAHADLGLGDSGWVHLMTEVMLRPVEDRIFPKIGSEVQGVGDGNWLAFAVACRWLSDLTYVYNNAGGNDLMVRHHQNWDPAARFLQLKGFAPERRDELMAGPVVRQPEPDVLDPIVPFNWMRWDEYRADRPFDVICLARSPGFTPASSDHLFEAIRKTFIDETAFGRPGG